MYKITFWNGNGKLRSFHRQVTLKIIQCKTGVCLIDLLLDMIVVIFSERCFSKNWVCIIFIISSIFKNTSCIYIARNNGSFPESCFPSILSKLPLRWHSNLFFKLQRTKNNSYPCKPSLCLFNLIKIDFNKYRALCFFTQRGLIELYQCFTYRHFATIISKFSANDVLFNHPCCYHCMR